MIGKVVFGLTALGAALFVAQARPLANGAKVTPLAKLGAVARIGAPDFVRPSPDAAAAGSARAFGVACESDGDCASKVCSKGKRNGFCSMKCEADADCPTPPTAGACNGRGFCKRADK